VWSSPKNKCCYCGDRWLTALEGFVVGDADVLEHVGVAGEHCRGGERQEDGGCEEGSRSRELVGHGLVHASREPAVVGSELCGSASRGNGCVGLRTTREGTAGIYSGGRWLPDLILVLVAYDKWPAGPPHVLHGLDDVHMHASMWKDEYTVY